MVSYDYAFLSDREEKGVESKKKKAQETTRLLIGNDSKSKAFFAHAIPHKGIHHGSWNFECVSNNLRKLGYRRVVLKNDKEPSIVAQVREAQRVTGGVEIVEELSHTGDPQSNGDVEQAVCTIKAKTISILATLERDIKQKVPLAHPVVGWAAQYAADCVNRYMLREDGLSAFQKLRGGNARQPVAKFGECVLFPMLKREQEKWGAEVEHAGRWAKGIWLGRSWNSNENLVVTANGISRPRTIRRLPTERKWRADLVQKITTAPWGEDLAEGDDEEKIDEEEKPKMDLRIC